jgi:hypothetical protein
VRDGQQVFDQFLLGGRSSRCDPTLSLPPAHSGHGTPGALSELTDPVNAAHNSEN